MIEVKDVSFSYNSKKYALRDINLVINEGSIVGIAGHNGAGKTTLLRIVSGLLKPNCGIVTIVPRAEKGDVAFIPDNGGFYSELTAIDNVRFRMQIARSEMLMKSPDDYLNMVDLLKVSNELAKTFSHGMKKRLAIACALASNPRFILLDESLNGVDPESLEIILTLLKKAASQRITILISSHDLHLLETLCSAVLIMDCSRCVFFEATNQLDDSFRSIYFNKTNKDRGVQQ